LHTLNEALYGIPIGRFANTAKILFATPDLNARLCDISWIARNRFWFAVAPIMYAVRKNGHERGAVFRRLYAQTTWRTTTAVTR
jgi:hypothetical protein